MNKVLNRKSPRPIELEMTTLETKNRKLRNSLPVEDRTSGFALFSKCNQVMNVYDLITYTGPVPSENNRPNNSKKKKKKY